MSRIRTVATEMVYDSRGRPTVEAEVVLESGARGRAAAPSGASTGTHEVSAFPKGGVPEALNAVRARVAPALVGQEAADQSTVDSVLHEVDGTPDLSSVGGNTTTAISVACALATAHERGQPLWSVLARPGVDGRRFPAIVGNCINGGRHAIGGPDMQEFIAYSDDPDPARSIRAALRVHTIIGDTLHRRYPTAALGRGDEGGWVAAIGNVEALETLAAACGQARDELGIPVHPGIDLAASEFFEAGRYRYKDRVLDTDGQVAFVAQLVDQYGLRYVEDPLDQEAFEPFAALTRAVGNRTLLVGDDLYVTNVSRLRRGLDAGSSNAILIKVNQVGTLTDTFRTVDLATSKQIATVTSHRSGEVPDDWLSHVAVGTGARALKCGLLGGERVAKLNELLRLARASTSGPHAGR